MVRLKFVRLLVAAIPCFMLWNLLASFVLVPVFLPLQTHVLNAAFEDINPVIVRFEGEWVIEADVFKAKKFYPDFSYEPSVDANFPSRLTVERPQSIMLGLLVTWLCLITMLARPDKYIFQASALSCLAILLAMIPTYYLKTVDLITTEDLLRAITVDNYIIVPNRPGETALVVIKGIRDTLSVCSTLVFPLAISLCFLIKEQQKLRGSEADV